MTAPPTENWARAHEERLEERIAADLRRLRQTHRSSLEEIAQYLGHEKNWLSKIETGRRRVFASDLLLIVNLLRDLEPEHPLVAAFDYYARGPGRNLRVVKR